MTQLRGICRNYVEAIQILQFGKIPEFRQSKIIYQVGKMSELRQSYFNPSIWKDSGVPTKLKNPAIVIAVEILFCSLKKIGAESTDLLDSFKFLVFGKIANIAQKVYYFFFSKR